MNRKLGMVFCLLLPEVLLGAGCASAPKPAECKGEFRPVNVAQKGAMVDGKLKVVRCNPGDVHGQQG